MLKRQSKAKQCTNLAPVNSLYHISVQIMKEALVINILQKDNNQIQSKKKYTYTLTISMSK